ncbi:helix-turn-helix domain-containing protein [Lactococcus hodotermopsidis]|uniref:helix-turn-helix domain-containing protein n=1 Tax=Pseudolactococcus hodotermopsidis TaxID=2709157 RepID=UPI0015567214|nr:AraC family transcriptional regulator [Lactococcus hodotermopsidis]
MNYLLSEGYSAYLNNESNLSINFCDFQCELSILLKEKGEFDGIIISKECLVKHIDRVDPYEILAYYEGVLEKFENTSLFDSIKKILDNPDKSYKLADISEDCYMSTATFNRKFKEIEGKTFTKFYRSFKVMLAKKMIRQGLKTQEISNRLGFSEKSYFERVFKQLTGRSPGKYRKEVLR